MTAAKLPRCVHLLPDTHDAGAENQARYLISGLAESGEWDLEVAYFGAGRAHQQFEAIGAPMLHLPRRGRFRFDAIGRARRLRRAYADRPPDVLHTWLLEGNVIGLLAARAWPTTRVVITQRGSWNEFDYRALVWLQRLLLGTADAGISNSSGGARMLESIGMRGERISVIRNGIPLERVATDAEPAEVRARMGWRDRTVVAWVGRVSDGETAAQKDLRTLFAAFDQLRARRPTALLAMIGVTVEEMRAVGFEPPEDAITLGWQSRAVDLLNAADVLVLSSRTEGDSNVVGEALLLGLPVATTDSGDHCTAVRDAGGRVVARSDPRGLAAAMEHLLADPPERASVRAAAAQRLSVERMVAETNAVYSGLIFPRDGRQSAAILAPR